MQNREQASEPTNDEDFGPIEEFPPLWKWFPGVVAFTVAMLALLITAGKAVDEVAKAVGIW